MHPDVLFWLSTTLFWTLVMSFYSTQEMACISYNRLRLEYYVSQNKRWAKWLYELTENPTRLFATTLIGVNVAMMASSESARRLYEALGLNPNLAPLTHIPFVLLFGELVPMFAARIHAEHMSRLGIPFLYATSIILSPISRVIEACFNRINRHTKQHRPSLISREELQKLFEEHEVGFAAESDEEFNAVVSSIFSLRSKHAFQLMKKLKTVPLIADNETVAVFREKLRLSPSHFALVYKNTPHKIIGVIETRALLKVEDTKTVGDYAVPVTFVAESMHGVELLKILQQEESGLVVVLNTFGWTVGVVSSDDLFHTLFKPEEIEPELTHPLIYLEKTFPAEMTIASFSQKYNIILDSQNCTTFAELILQMLGRIPVVGDTIFIDPIEITVIETTLFNAKTIKIQTK